MPPNFRPQKTKVYAPACSIYLSTQYNSATNQSFHPIIPFFLTPKFRFSSPKSSVFSSYRNIFFLPPHHSIIRPDYTLLSPRLRHHFTLSSFLPFLFLRL